MSRELEPALGIAADREPKLGGMIGEGILVTREQIVIAGFSLCPPGLRLVGLAGFAQDAGKLRRVVGIVGCQRQRPKAGDAVSPGSTGGDLLTANSGPVTTAGIIAVGSLKARIDGQVSRAAGGRLTLDERADLIALRGHVLGCIADAERAAALADELVVQMPSDARSFLTRSVELADVGLGVTENGGRVVIACLRALVAVLCHGDPIVVQDWASRFLQPRDGHRR